MVQNIRTTLCEDIESSQMYILTEYILLQPSNSIYLKKLVISPNKQCWNLSINVIVYNLSYPTVDQIILGIKSALRTTLLPHIDLYEYTNYKTSEKQVNYSIALSNKTKQTELLSLKEYDSMIPYIITMYRFTDDIWIVDPTIEESSSITSYVAIILNKDMNIIGTSKSSIGCINKDTIKRLLCNVPQICLQLCKQFEIAFIRSLNIKYIDEDFIDLDSFNDTVESTIPSPLCIREAEMNDL